MPTRGCANIQRGPSRNLFLSHRHTAIPFEYHANRPTLQLLLARASLLANTIMQINPGGHGR